MSATGNGWPNCIWVPLPHCNMSEKLRTWYRHIVLASLALGLCSCQRTQSAPTGDHSKTMRTVGKLTPRCVGRYTIDLHQEFVLNSQGGQNIDGVALDVEPATAAAFAAQLASRTAKLESTAKLGPKQNYPMLRTTIPLPGGAKGVVFDRAESDVAGGR